MKMNLTLPAALMTVLFAIGLHGQTINVNLKVCLEGPFDGAFMGTSLNSGNHLPLTQPYNTAPWNYQGNENVAAIPNTDVVDWVLVELRETAGDASTAYEGDSISSQAGFLLKNGSIVTLDGASPMQFTVALSYKLFAVVYHRNHLPVLSGGQLILNGGNYTWDYTTGAVQAYGGTNAHKEMIGGIWGMISGDGNANGQVNNADKNDVWNPQSGYSGYKTGDFNLNGQVDNVDKNDHWRVNSGRSSQVVGSWTCGKPFADVRDGQVYSSVQIGTQCWMAENLNIGNMIAGTSNQTNNGITEKYCYGDDPSNCDIYGGLYQWNEMMQYVTTPGVKGICPEGWHLPTDAEYCTLTVFIDPTVSCSIIALTGTDVGTKMKSTSGWYGGGNGTNTSGFTALPGGYRSNNQSFNHLTQRTGFWSSSESDSYAWFRFLYYDNVFISRDKFSKYGGLSVRCVKDMPNQPPAEPSNPNPPNNTNIQQLTTQLSWTCTDPENDPLTFDVYFGAGNPPELVSTGQTALTFDTGTLVFNTTYYWKIVAYDDHAHTTEGPVWCFTIAPWQCGDPLHDSRDNQTYTTVQIGTQCWMAENLNIGTMIAGTIDQTDNSIIEKYCYGNSTANCDVYGGLYQWNEMMQYVTTPGVQGICPDGWHLPTDEEYCTLTQFIDATVNCSTLGWSGTDVGSKMKSITGWWGGGNNTNASGFTALPGGYRMTNGGFNALIFNAYFWTSSENVSDAWHRYLQYASAPIYRWDNNKYYGYSVRCLRD